MATKTGSKKAADRNQDRGIFNFEGGGSGGLVAGAVVAGAALGLVANYGRKLAVQAASGASGDWVDALATEHRLALAIFDKIEATDDSQVKQRTALLMKLKYALSKHAFQEENVVYPALRQANQRADADHLGEDHGYVKTYLYELENMPKDSPEWLARVRDFRDMIETHMTEEEERIFPAFREDLTDDQNAKITALMHKEGMKLA